MLSFRVIGPGRAGRSLAAALVDTGCLLRGLLGRGDDLRGAAEAVDLLVLATPDDALAEVATVVRPSGACVVAHLSGALGLEVLASHSRRASIHPLVPLPSPEVGRLRLRSGVNFAVAGDHLATTVVDLLGGRVISVPDDRRAAYHAAACIASNHFVGLLGQVARVASTAGLDLEDFLGLTRAALADVEELGPEAALTGPAARGDDVTLERHRAAIDPDERPGYEAGVALVRRLAGDRRLASTAAER